MAPRRRAGMRCLSISQPYADLVASGAKTVELRSWNTRFRGEFLVHAPLRVRARDCARLRMDPSSLVTGAVIGRATLHGVIEYPSAAAAMADSARHLATRSMLARGRRVYGFELRGASRLAVPVPLAGRLGLFEAPAPRVTDSEILTGLLEDEQRYGLVGHH